MLEGTGWPPRLCRAHRQRSGPWSRESGGDCLWGAGSPWVTAWISNELPLTVGQGRDHLCKIKGDPRRGSPAWPAAAGALEKLEKKTKTDSDQLNQNLWEDGLGISEF